MQNEYRETDAREFGHAGGVSTWGLLTQDAVDPVALVCEAYEKLGVSRVERDTPLQLSFHALATSNDALYTALPVTVVPVADAEPYANATEMRARIDAEGVLLVSSLFCEDHPYFLKWENIVFRAVHDYYTHYLGGRVRQAYPDEYAFDFRGELNCYRLHTRLAPREAWPALFSEVVGQLCYEAVHGTFPDPQLAAWIPGFGDFADPSQLDLDEYRAAMAKAGHHGE